MKDLSAKYPEEIPDNEYGKTVQSYEPITDFVIGILTPDTEWDNSVLYQLSDEQAADIYTLYRKIWEKWLKNTERHPKKRNS